MGEFCRLLTSFLVLDSVSSRCGQIASGKGRREDVIVVPVDVRRRKPVADVGCVFGSIIWLPAVAVLCGESPGADVAVGGHRAGLDGGAAPVRLGAQQLLRRFLPPTSSVHDPACVSQGSSSVAA